MSREYIASVLKRLREKSGLTADQVGEMIGKSGKTVNAWENNRGQPDAEILMQLCSIYNVKNILNEFNPNSERDDIVLSEHEKALIIAYRSNPAMQSSVDKLLGIDESTSENIHIVKIAARNGGDIREVTLTDSELEKIKKEINNLPDVDDL